MLDIAKDYVFKNGYSVIPLQYKGKKPALSSWDEYQKRKPTEEELKKWFSDNNKNIGIVTGKISGLSVIDLDGEDAVNFMTAKESLPITPIVKTGKEYGYHLYCQNEPSLRNIQDRLDLPHIDIRSEGGYVVAPPSIHPNGKQYEWFNPLAVCTPFPAWLLSVINSSKYLSTCTSVRTLTTSNKDCNQRAIFTEGRRDIDLFHVANSMVRGGLEQDYIQKVLELVVNSWGEHDPKWVEDKIKSALKRSESKIFNIAAEVKEYALSTNGHFLSTNVHNDLHLSTREDKKAASMALSRLCEGEGRILERVGNKNGCFQLIPQEAQAVNWIDDDSTPIRVHYPFGIDLLVKTMEKNIIVVAGSTDAGKSAFALNFVVQNMDKHKGNIHYFSSEMGSSEMKQRALLFGYSLEYWRDKFNFYEIGGDFHNQIKPDGINIIDYLDVTDEFYKVGDYIKKVWAKLNRGICMIALQKNPGLDYGLGGMRSAEKARIYIAMEGGVLKIVKAKNRQNPAIDPNGKKKNYELVAGCKFTNVSEWY